MYFLVAYVILDHHSKRGKLEIKIGDLEINARIIETNDWHSALCKAFGPDWVWPSSSIEAAKKYAKEKHSTLIEVRKVEIDLWCSSVSGDDKK
jgi:hypothetical protein